MKNNNYKYLNDRPVQEDKIGHYEIIADQLHSTMHCNLEKPFVIGLFGSWGTGKSSIIEMLKNRCEKDEEDTTKVIVVDAWRKDKDIFNRQFLKKIAKELFGNDKRYEEVRKQVDEKKSESTSRWVPSKIAWFLFSFVVLILMACILVAIWGWYNQKEEINPFPSVSLASAVVGILLACYFQFILPKFSVITGTHMSDTSVHNIDHFREIYFDNIIAKSNAKCVCIVIDNLDRVEAGDALAIIRTLKTFIVDAKDDVGTREVIDKKTYNKVVFIVPCCNKELEKQVNKYSHGDNNGYGAEFLNKFFNVSFSIPEFREQDAFQFAQDLIKEMGLDFEEQHKSTICHIISESYGNNPRKAKIFLNEFLMRYNTAKACEMAGKIDSGVITKHPDRLAIYMSQDSSSRTNNYISRLMREVTSECQAAIKYLKKPNDFDMIEDFTELLEMARRNENEFSELISTRPNESQNIIDAIWRNTIPGDYRSQLNIIASVISAIDKNSEILIPLSVAQKMAACLASRYPQDLQGVSGKLVYERILKNRPEENISVIPKLGQVVNDASLSKQQVMYCANVLGAILEDSEALLYQCSESERDTINKLIPEAIDKLVGLGVQIVPVALRSPEYKSKRLFDKAIELCSKGGWGVIAEDVVTYCMSLDESKEDESFSYICSVIQSFNSGLKLYCENDKWNSEAEKCKITRKRCLQYIRATRRIINYAYEQNMPSAESEVLLQTSNHLITHVIKNIQLDVFDLFRDFEKYERWTGAMVTANNHRNTRGEEIILNGNEQTVCNFISDNIEFVDEILYQQLAAAGGRFQSVCNIILESFPTRRVNVIPEIWKTHKEWVSGWIKNNSSKMDKNSKKDSQKIFFDIAINLAHPVDVYHVLGDVKVGNDKEAIDARTNHFETLIDSQELSTIEGLEYVLERFKAALCHATKEQNELLRNGWRKIDQDTAGDELKRLANDIIKF